MKIHDLTVEKAQQLNEQFLNQLIEQGVEKMDNEQQAITKALDAFEGMHFWVKSNPQRAKLYACEFELLQSQLEKWLEGQQ